MRLGELEFGKLRVEAMWWRRLVERPVEFQAVVQAVEVGAKIQLCVDSAEE